MDATFAAAAHAIPHEAVSGQPRVPGVVAMAPDRTANVYEGAAGLRRLGDAQPMTTDAVLAIFSCSKAITGTAALQLAEQGRLDLDAPAKSYVPAIGELQVLEGFDDSGALRLRKPKRDITTGMRMLHTAGFGYPFLGAPLKRLAAEHGQPDPQAASRGWAASETLQRRRPMWSTSRRASSADEISSSLST